MSTRWAPIIAAALMILVSAFNSFSSPQEILGRRYSRESGRLFIADNGGVSWEVAPGTILVRFSPSASAADVSEFEQSNLLWPTARLTANAAGYRRFRYTPDRDPLDVLTAVVAERLVQDACLDTEVKFFGDPYYGNQWNLQKMRIEKAWEITRGDPLITIAILDKGTDYGHEDLSDAMWWNPHDADGDGMDGDTDSLWYGTPMVDDFTGWDFRSNDNEPLPESGTGHGTEVAGIAIAVCDNNLGVAGACGSTDANGVKLMTIRVDGQAGSSVADAVEYAWRKGATVVNMSFGILNESANAVPAQLDSAEAHGVIVVAAVGNFGEFPYPTSHVYFPALYPSVIAVGATDENDLRWPFSCKGPELDVVAPSGGAAPNHYTEMWTTDNYQTPGSDNPENCGGCPPDNFRYYSRFGWTSAASPEVASIAALLKSHMPELTPTQVRQKLFDSAVDLGDAGFDSLYGYGRVDAYRALTEWGTITGNVTWLPEDTADSTRYISGDLTIAPGATLTIMPGTIIKIANDDDLTAPPDTAKIEINVEGTLVANGTAADPIVFEPWHPTTTEDWVGIYFDSLSGGGTFNHCVIKRAEYAIESYVPLEVRNTEIASCRYAGVVSQDGGAFLKACVLTQPGTFGIFLTADTSVVRNTVVDAAASAGVHVQPSADLVVRGSTVQNCDTGLYVNGSASVDVDSTSYVWMNDTGFHFYSAGASSMIRSCGITWNASTAILCDDSSPWIESNTLAHNGSGIYCSNSSSPVIESNKMQSSGNMVTATSSSRPDVGHGGQSGGDNKIAFSSKYVVNFTDSTIYAENNCWNVTAPPCNPPANKFTGGVDRSNPCCEPFPLFPRGEGEPEPSESFVFELPPPTTSESRKKAATGLVSIVPNPFNPTTTIHYSLAVRGAVEIKIFDVGGRLVQTLANETQVAGAHAALWKGTDRRGSPVASGIYFVRMVAAGQVFTRKMVLLK